MRDKIRFYLKISTVFIIFFAIFSYGYYEASNLLKGPKIIIEYPQNGITVNKELISILGTATNISYISINGRPIYTDSSGKFAEKIILSSGYNSLYIEARDRIGKESKETLEIILNEKIATTTKDGLAKN